MTVIHPTTRALLVAIAKRFDATAVGSRTGLLEQQEAYQDLVQAELAWNQAGRPDKNEDWSGPMIMEDGT